MTRTASIPLQPRRSQGERAQAQRKNLDVKKKILGPLVRELLDPLVRGL